MLQIKMYLEHQHKKIVMNKQPIHQWLILFYTVPPNKNAILRNKKDDEQSLMKINNLLT